MFLGNSSNLSEEKTDKFLSVHPHQLRNICVESKIEEDLVEKINLELKIYHILIAFEKQFLKILLIYYLMIQK